MEQIDKLLRREISLILGKIKDKYLGFLTVTRVETSRDLSSCHVWISSLEEKSIKEITQVIKHYNRDIYNHLKARVVLKKIPHLIFKVDKTASNVDRVERLLHEIDITDKSKDKDLNEE